MAERGIYLFLSYFDQILGPNELYSNAPLDKNLKADLGRILEFIDGEGDFVFTFRKYQTINYIFYIDSEYARGGKDILMITYIIRAAYFKDEITDVYNYLQSKTPDLVNYADELRNLSELPKILHASKDRTIKNILDHGSKKFKTQFKTIYDKYMKILAPSIPIHTSLIGEGDLKKVYIFGPPQSGRSTLLKNLEVIQFLQYKQINHKRDLVNKIYDLIIDNIEILTYDTTEKKPSISSDYIENSQGFILIYDASNKDSLGNAIDMFQLIFNSCLEENEKLPIVIVGNKFNNEEEVTSEEFMSHLNLEELADCGIPVHHYSINVLSEDTKMLDALRWLVKQIM